MGREGGAAGQGLWRGRADAPQRAQSATYLLILGQHLPHRRRGRHRCPAGESSQGRRDAVREGGAKRGRWRAAAAGSPQADPARGAEGGRRERDERGVGLNRAPTMTAVFVVRRGERGLVLRVPTSLLRCCPPGHCERSIYPLINRIHRGEPSSPAPGGRPSRARACVCVCGADRERHAARHDGITTGFRLDVSRRRQRHEPTKAWTGAAYLAASLVVAQQQPQLSDRGGALGPAAVAAAHIRGGTAHTRRGGGRRADPHRVSGNHRDHLPVLCRLPPQGDPDPLPHRHHAQVPPHADHRLPLVRALRDAGQLQAAARHRGRLVLPGRHRSRRLPRLPRHHLRRQVYGQGGRLHAEPHRADRRVGGVGQRDRGVDGAPVGEPRRDQGAGHRLCRQRLAHRHHHLAPRRGRPHRGERPLHRPLPRLPPAPQRRRAGGAASAAAAGEEGGGGGAAAEEEAPASGGEVSPWPRSRRSASTNTSRASASSASSSRAARASSTGCWVSTCGSRSPSSPSSSTSSPMLAWASPAPCQCRSSR